MSSDRDTTRIVRSWLRLDEHESADRVLGAVLDQLDTTPQRRAIWWPARRLPIMNSTVKYGLAVAVVAVAALIGFNYLVGPNVGSPGLGDPTPPPTPVVLASGRFTAPLTDVGMGIDIDATRIGADVSGDMTVTSGDTEISADLQCARTTEDGLMIIGGEVTASNHDEEVPGDRVAVMLQPGTPVTAAFWLEDPPPADDCQSFVDGIPTDDTTFMQPIEGDLQLGP